jgi:hypothetical protein
LDLQDKLDEIEKELEQKPIESKDIEVNLLIDWKI